MKVTAVIAEYNPLHNGHVLHINAAKEATGADFMVAVMSGDYVQRGCPAIVSKYERTRSVLMAGADLVLELPLVYSSASLEYFALGAVSPIQRSGIADCISFGSECGDTELLKEASGYIKFLSSTVSPTDSCMSGKSSLSADSGISGKAALTDKSGISVEPDGTYIKDSLSRGINYSCAVNSGDNIPEHIRDVLRTPNNLLAAAYIKAAKLLSFDCEFHTVKRTGSDYHDSSAGALSSSALRKELLNPSAAGEIELQALSTRMPSQVFSSLCEYLDKYPAMSEDDLSLLLFHKLQPFGDEPKALTRFLDVSSSLAHKIIREYAHASSFTDLCMKLKSKDLNYARISRALTHILLDIKARDVHEYTADGWHYYIRPLGLSRSSSVLMHELKLHSGIPIISKIADAPQILTDHFPDGTRYNHALRMFRSGILASDLYNKTACSKCRQLFISEYEHSPVVL